METNSIQFGLLVQLSTFGSSVERVTISCKPGEIFLDDQLTTVMYNGIQLRFTPVAKGFKKPRMATMALCFDDTDPNNPKIEDVYKKLEPFINTK